MDNIIKLLFTQKEEERNGKVLYSGFNLATKDPRIGSIYKAVNNALISVDTATKEKDDIIEEILIVMVEYTPKFINNAAITMEKLEEEIKKEKSEVAAHYFSYLKIRAVGAVKDKYKVTKKEEKKVIEEIFFNDLISGDFSEEQIADYLNINNGEYSAKSTSFSFNNWFMENKMDILTKAQIKFLNDNGEGYSKQLRYKYNKAIKNRVIKAINKEFSTTNLKKIELIKQIDTLNSIMQSENFIDAFKTNLNEPIIIDIIYSNKKFNFYELKEITALYNNITNSLNFKTLMKVLLTLDIKKANIIYKVKKM